MTIHEHIGVGRRKRATAAVRLRKGTGKIDCNHREISDYFPSKVQQETILAPFGELQLEAKGYDLIIRCKGGGLQGQMMAARLAVSRALVKEDEERRGTLKAVGYMRRDPRKRERKKYGLAGARKRFQFSKR